MDVTSNPNINFPPEKLQKTVDVIQEIRSQVAFLQTLLEKNACGATDVKTHMGLLRHRYDDLAALFGYDGVSRALDQAHSDNRAANLEIAELKRRLGKKTTAQGASSRLNALEQAFHTWRRLCGFDYVSTGWTQYSLTLEFTSHIDHQDDDDDKDNNGADSFGDRDLAGRIRKKVPYRFGKGSDWDLKKDSFHDDMLDTDKNREKLKDLLTSTFPGASVHGFSSHRDGQWYLLRMKGAVPWEAIETWLASVDPKAADDEGMYYVRLREIQATLASDRFMKDLGPAIERNLLRDAEKCQLAIAAYERWKAAPKDGGGHLLEDLRLEGPDGAFLIGRGLGTNASMERLELTFGLDAQRDLDPSWAPKKEEET